MFIVDLIFVFVSVVFIAAVVGPAHFASASAAPSDFWSASYGHCECLDANYSNDDYDINCHYEDENHIVCDIGNPLNSGFLLSCPCVVFFSSSKKGILK